MAEKVKAVIFDLDDTLYDCIGVNEQACEAVCEYAARKLLRINPKVVKEQFRRARLLIKEQLKDYNGAAIHNRMLYFEKTLELLGMPPASYALEMYDYFWNECLESMVLYPGVKKTLERLHRKGIKVAICTDMTVHIQHRKLRALGISEYIDVIVTSEEVGVEKPHPRMFAMTLAKLDMKVHEVVYVGDNLEKDVYGAHAVGIPAVWYCEDESRWSELDGNNLWGMKDYKEFDQLLHRIENRDIEEV